MIKKNKDIIEVHNQCLQQVNNACFNDNRVKYLLSHLKKLGCTTSVENQRIVCEQCDPNFLGGFDPDAKEVVICENNISCQKEVNTILTHELIHAYDVCRAKYDSQNVKHLACSEIRAANLSGDCTILKEFFRSIRMKNQKQECVKRKAIDSITAVKNLSREEAGQVVQSVFNDCFNDTEPFQKN